LIHVRSTRFQTNSRRQGVDRDPKNFQGVAGESEIAINGSLVSMHATASGQFTGERIRRSTEELRELTEIIN